MSFQTAYACRHAGACCSAGWIEPLADGVCRYFDGRLDGACSIHRRRGHEALPLACQQFPRVATLSPLGTSVTLSAFCPTAAGLLFGDGPFAITVSENARDFDGLDAREVLPPLLRPGMLMDWEAVAAWETLAVRTLSDWRHDSDAALTIIEQASASVCAAWTPDAGALSDALVKAFTEAAGVSAATALKDRRRDRSLARPRPAGAAEMPAASVAAARARYYAAHAFACWPMYDGKGIRGALDWLLNVQTALAEERRLHPTNPAEAFRQADLRLRHATSPA